ncbi:MAG: IS66 family transposase [bacterium]|nr:IS66 family transposase [bacterium]
MSSKALRREIKELKAKLADRDAKIEDLAHDLSVFKDHLNRLLASRSRGHLVAEGQGVLFPDPPASDAADIEPASDSTEQPDDDDDDDGDPPADSQRTRKKRPRKIDTSALPREDRMHELPEQGRICPDTGLPLVPVGEKIFDEIDYQRAKLTLIRHHQVVYGLAPEHTNERQANAITAPMPPRPLEGCAASATLLAWLIVQKYANHLPLYRQESIFARDGLRLPRQTLCDWLLGATEALRPIADCLMARVRAGPVMQLDDTPVKCQGGRGEKHFQAYLWTFVNPEVGGVAYRFTSGRASDLIAIELGNFAGWLVGDGYSGNSAASKKVEGSIKCGGCWAHVNRKFKDARSDAPGTAKLFRDDIKRLFAVERKADEAGLDPEARLKLRWQESLPALAALRARALRLKDDFSDSDNIAKAIKYLHNQRRELRRFLEDGRIPLDNNACERAIRPIAVGRRNWLFAGSPRGGRAAAVAYTLIESCRIAKVDTIRYLADILVRVATHPASRVEELLPDRWQKLVAGELKPQPVLA